MSTFNRDRVDKPFECYHCWYKAKSKESLEDHMRLSHLTEKPFKCDKCDFRAIRKNHLTQHMKTHVVNVYGCSLCDFKSYSEKRAKQHLNVHRKIHDKDNRRGSVTANETTQFMKCGHCDYRVSNERDMKDHILAHSDETTLICSYCHYRTGTKGKLRQHMTIHMGDSVGTHGDQRASDGGHWLAHSATQMREKVYFCEDCNFKTTGKSKLDQHKLWKHGGVRPCEKCGFTATSQQQFRDHNLKHTMEKPFSCIHCPYTSYIKSNFASHQRIHAEKTITCSYCPYSARKERDMKRHLENIHSTHKKRFKCKECHYRTAEKKAFRNHQRVHTGQKPFSCSVCDKTYNRKPALKRHIVKFHAIEEEEHGHVCSLCGYKGEIFRTKSTHELAEHILSSHTAQDVPPAIVETVKAVETTEKADVGEFHSCTVCHEVFHESLHLQDHTVRSHARRVGTGIACCACDHSYPVYSTKTVEAMSDHVLSSHAALSVPPNQFDAVPIDSTPVLLDIVDYVCNHCNHKSEDVSEMAKHMLVAHSASETTAAMVLPKSIHGHTLRTFVASETQFDA